MNEALILNFTIELRIRIQRALPIRRVRTEFAKCAFAVNSHLHPYSTRFLLAGAQVWHARAEATRGQMSAVATGLRMMLVPQSMQVEVGTIALEGGLQKGLRRPPPPPPWALRHGRGEQAS